MISFLLLVILGIACDRWLTAPRREAERERGGARTVRR